MPNPEKTDSGDESPQIADRKDVPAVTRRRTLQLAGAVAASSLTAGCTGGESAPTSDIASGTQAALGYGGVPAIEDRFSIPNPLASVGERGDASAVDAIPIEADGNARRFETPQLFDLFVIDVTEGTDLTITFDGSALGETTLAMFGPSGAILDQVQVNADAPVQLPETAADGTHYLQVVNVRDDEGTYSLSASTTRFAAQQSPYEGTVADLPGRVQAENFDTGGDGVAYHDTTEGNEYGLDYRDTDVDIRATIDRDGGYNIGYFQKGEWLEYTVNPAPGTYDVHLRVATERSNRQLEITLDGDTLGTVDVPNTGDWSNWTTVTLEDVPIPSGSQQTLRVEALRSGIDFDWIEFEAVELKAPYGDSAASVPGQIEAEHFDLGGQGVSYHDTTAGNEYGLDYRDTDVDIRETADADGGYNIGYFEDGEWLEYTIDPMSGTYDVHLRVATARSDRQLELTLDGDALATVDVPNTGDWSNWTTVTVSDVAIDTNATSVLRVEPTESGVDLDRLEFERVETQGPFGDTVPALPGRVQAEHFDTGGDGVAYHDTTDGSEYDLDYRDTDVDIRETADEDGGYNIGYFEDGEWLEYTVAPTPGTYSIHLRVATARSGRQLTVSLAGEQLTTVDVPNTGDWSNWTTVTVDDIDVTQDSEAVLRLEAVGSGIDFDWVEFELAQDPYGGSAAAVPGRVEAEDFDTGGEGVAYHDTTAGSEYGLDYRDTDVDIRETQDSAGNYNVGYFEDGEWLEYTIDVTPGTYDLRVRVASANSNRQLEITLDGDTLGTVDVPNTGDWSNWETVTLSEVDLTVDGTQVLRFEALGSGIDFNWFEFVDSTDTTSTDDDYGELGYGEGGYGE